MQSEDNFGWSSQMIVSLFRVKGLVWMLTVSVRTCDISTDLPILKEIWECVCLCVCMWADMQMHQKEQWEYLISCPVPWNYSVCNCMCVFQHCNYVHVCTGFNYVYFFSAHVCLYVHICIGFAHVYNVYQGQTPALKHFFFFWWQFLYCPGSCGHSAHSWCCGCPLRRGEIKADARCHKGACLVLFNSPKLWHGAKAAPRYGKHSITGTITTAQWDTVGETEAEKWKKKHSLSLALFLFSHSWTHTCRV